MKFSSDTPFLAVLILMLLFFTYSVLQLGTDSIGVQNVAKKSVVKKPLITYTSAKQKKYNFRKRVAPALNEVYDELEEQYNDISEHIDDEEYAQRVAELKVIYKVDTNEKLLMALKPHPKSVAIAQAAIESAWITSRFFREANNIFGVWSVNKNEPRIAASQKRGDRTIWLKKYPTIKDSIRDYYKTIAISSAYSEFRELNMITDDPHQLVMKLDNYSELREVYTEELSEMIEYNKFYLYDK